MELAVGISIIIIGANGVREAREWGEEHEGPTEVAKQHSLEVSPPSLRGTPRHAARRHLSPLAQHVRRSFRVSQPPERSARASLRGARAHRPSHTREGSARCHAHAAGATPVVRSCAAALSRHDLSMTPRSSSIRRGACARAWGRARAGGSEPAAAERGAGVDAWDGHPAWLLGIGPPARRDACPGHALVVHRHHLPCHVWSRDDARHVHLHRGAPPRACAASRAPARARAGVRVEVFAGARDSAAWLACLLMCVSHRRRARACDHRNCACVVCCACVCARQVVGELSSQMSDRLDDPRTPGRLALGSSLFALLMGTIWTARAIASFLPRRVAAFV
jgi:hypothetical protein